MDFESLETITELLLQGAEPWTQGWGHRGACSGGAGPGVGVLSPTPRCVAGTGGALTAAKRGSSLSCRRAQAGWCLAGVLCQGILPPCSSLSTSLGRISEATNLGTRPQQALKPQSRSSDHPRPQPSREHVSCSGHMGRAWGNQGSLCGCKQPQGEGHILLPQDMLVGLGGAAGSQIPDAGVGTLLWATGKG